MTKREQFVREAEELGRWLESREFEVKELGLDFLHLHVKKSALIRRLLSLLPKEGEVVVPLEPTKEMVIAAQHHGLDTYDSDIISGYKAMIKARPK